MERKKRRKRPRIIHMMILFIFLYIGLIFWNQRNLMKGLEAKRKEVGKEIQSLEKEIKELNEEIDSSGTLQFVEKVARDDLGMVKPREIIYIDKAKKKNPFLSFIKNQN